MSVKIFYDTPSKIALRQLLGGFCYCRRIGTGGKPTERKPFVDPRILIDVADTKPYTENPIVSSIDFGIVPVETSVYRDFFVFSSSGKCPRTLTLDTSLDGDEQFDRGFRIVFPVPDLLPDLGCGDNRNVGKERKLRFRLYFEPEVPAMHYARSFTIKADNIPIRVECQGLCDGPSVCFSENVINFGGQYYRDESRFKIKINNASACEGKFQFDNDNLRSPFKICPTFGVIPPFSTLTIEIHFQATKPQAYYKRVMCLIHHQHPQYLDLIGICIPRPFFVSSPIDFGLSIAETLFLPLPTDSNSEYFNSHAFWGVKLSQALVDFGYLDVSQPGSSVENKTLSMTSDLPYDVIIDWIPDPTGVFQISPNNIFLASGRSALVEVSFRPTFPDTFFSGQLECYIRPTEYVWSEKDGPPWIFTHKEELLNPNTFETSTIAESFAPESDHNIPLIEVPSVFIDLDQQEDEEDEDAEEAAEAEEEELPHIRLISKDTKRRITLARTIPALLKAGKKATFKDRKKGKASKKLLAAVTESVADMKTDAKRRQSVRRTTTSTDSTKVHLPSKTRMQSRSYSKGTSKGISKLKLHRHHRPEDELHPEDTDHDQDHEIEDLNSGFPGLTEFNLDFLATLQSETSSIAELEPEPAPKPKQRRKCSTFIDDPFTLPLTITLKHANTVTQTLTLEPITHLVDALENPSVRLSVTSTSLRKWSLAEAERTAMMGFLEDAAASVSRLQSEVQSELQNEDDEFKEFQTYHRTSSVLIETQDEAQQTESLKEVNPCFPQELALPLCLSVRVTGHTYQRHPPVTRFKLPRAVTMYPTWPASQVCRTFVLKNNNDLPVAYDASILTEDGEGAYRIKPSKGLIPGNFHQIIMVQMNPKMTSSSLYPQNCEVVVNNEDKNMVMFRGMAESPVLEFIFCYAADVEGRGIVFPETVPGSSTETCIQLRNPSRFHYRYEVTPTAREDANVFTVSPSEGIIVPYQTVKLNLKFLPMDTFDYYSQWKFTFYLMRSRIETRNVITSYILQMPFVATCRDAIVLANPTLLDFELVQIFSTKSMTLTLHNTGHANVNVSLRAMHEEWLQWYPSEQIQIEPKQLSLNGLESAEINVTIRPDRTNFQRFYIDYELELNDQTKSAEIISEEKSQKGPKRFHRISEIRFLGDHAVFSVSDILMISRHPVWNAGQSWSMFSIDRFNHVLKPSHTHSGQHRIPAIPTISFRFPPATIDTEPALFNILLSNRDALGGTWQMMPSPPKEWIKSLFSQRKQHSKAPFFGTEDEDLLKEIWKLKFISMSQENDNHHSGQVQNNHGSEAKPANSKGPPSSVTLMNMLIQHLTDMEYFYVSPIGGQLTSGEQMQISLRYSYKRVGKHEMTVLFRVHPGVFVWVAMKGMTLPPQTAYVQHMHREEMLLHPISLADMDPPIQLFWMYNGGDVSADFDVVTKPFEECPDVNYGHEVFECLNPKGTIGAKSWAAIRIRFSPIEIKEYSIPLIVAVNGKLTRVVLLKGIPSFSQGLLIRPEVTGFHMEQKFVLINPLIPILLSPAHVIFQKFIPTGQKATSVVFLTNLSNTNVMSYTWPDVPIDGGGSITFEPDNGLLQKNEQKACMVVIKGGKTSTTFSRIIRVVFVDETLLAVYESKMRDRNTCRARLMGKKMSAEDVAAEITRQLGPEPERTPSFSRLVSISAYISSSFGILNTMDTKDQGKIPAIPRCKPLPPVANGKQRLTLPPFAQQLSREIITNILWDLMNSDSMESFIKDGAGVKAPLFSDYKKSEEERARELRLRAKYRKFKSRSGQRESDDEPSPTIPPNGTQEILEQVVFNMVQEVASSFEPRTIPQPLEPVQPRQLVNVKRYRSAFV